MPIEIFCCYAREDEALLNQLKRHLTPLQKNGHINLKHDRDISAGMEWQHEIDGHLNAAHIILLLISPDFIASDYCYGIEMKRALERHQRNEARVIPIILRHTYWQEIKELAQLQALPKDAIPIMSASGDQKDEAFLDVVKSIHKVADEVNAKLLKVGGTFTIKRTIEERLTSSPSFTLVRDIHSDRQTSIHRLLCQLVDEQPELELAKCSKRIVRFGIKSWDVPALKTSNKESSSERILLFTIEDKEQSLDFQLGMGSELEDIDIRKKLFRMAQSNKPFRVRAREFPTRWTYLYQREILHSQFYSELSDGELEAAIRKEWSFFMEDTLPRLDAVLKQQEWFR